jgi:hypothetical protein
MIEAGSPSLKGFKRGEPWRHAITSACNHNIWQLYIAGTESRSKFRFYSCDLVTIPCRTDENKWFINCRRYQDYSLRVSIISAAQRQCFPVWVVHPYRVE